MINFKKMDDEDFVFINKPLTQQEEKAFHDFLKQRKARSRRKKDAEKMPDKKNG